MTPLPRLLRSVLLLLLPLLLASAFAQTLDTVIFGDSASESAHGLNAPLTQVISGGLGQPARKMQLTPADPDGEGGYLEFTAKVDPLKTNHVTLKLWGSDSSSTASGIILLYQIEDGQLLQVGHRVPQVSEYAPLAWATRPEKPIPERFYYTTIPLPLSLTQGRTSVQLRVVGAEMNALGSLPVYRAYVHANAFFEPAAGDPQGTQPAPAPIKPSSTLSLQAALDKARATTIANMTSWLANNNGDLGQLVEGYSVSWTPAYQNPLVPPRLIANIDATCQAYFANPSSAGTEWGGSFGGVGDNIAKIGAAGFGAALDQVVNLGDPAGPAARRVLWAKMLKASLDSGRFARRGPTTNQTIINDKNLYGAQRGLVTLGSSLALPADVAMRYLYESMGLAPWLGPDIATGGRNSFMGANYYLVTPAGLTKENGYVSSYGEVYDVSTQYYTQTGDEIIKARAVEMFKARSHFRYPMVDANGYRTFRMVGPLDWRSQQDFPFDQGYGERGSRLVVAPVTQDPTAVAYARQMLDDNQGNTFGTDLASALLLETLVNTPDNGARLPMTEGQPDYAWADVDNGIVAIKRGEELTWIEPYWQTRAGLNSIARTFQITPTTARLATVRSDIQFTWNGTVVSRGLGVDWNNTPLPTANGLVQQAYLGDKLVQATAPADAQSNREEFVGRAAFYATRYGRYLVGINMDKANSYVLRTPAGFTSALELITRQTRSGTITVAPNSAVVLDLGVTTDANPVPNAPKYLATGGVADGISVLWETSGGATSYNLKRATVRNGAYTTIATGLGVTYPKKWGAWPSGTYLDTTAAAGTTYYYKVSAVNAAGESYDSPATTGTVRGTAIASVNTLPAPWKNINFAATGSAAHASGVFTLTGGGGDFWGAADGGHFVYQPLVGDGTVVARLTNPSGAYKVGVMIRASLATNSPQLSILRQGANLTGHRRTGVGGSTSAFGASVASPSPVWLRVQRQGVLVTLSWAPDASGAPGAWTFYASNELPLGSTAYVGLATTSGTPTFDNATVTSVLNPVATVPVAPAGLTATPGSGQVALSWLPVDGAATYTVKRATVSGGPYNFSPGTNLSALTVTNFGLTNGVTYYYIVTAKNALGESLPSTQVAAVPTAGPGNLQVAVTGTQAVLTWNALAGATGYTVRRSLDGVTWTTLTTGLTATTYTNTGLTNGQSYLYSVVATGSGAASGTSAVVTATTTPLAPLVLSADGEGTQARLRWSTVTGATTYRVKRSATLGGTYTTVATNLTSPAYTHTGLTPGADSFYVVTAVNAAGESVASAPMKAGWGTGLLAQYYNNTAATGLPLAARIDATPLNANWANGSPDALVNNDNFSVVWAGQLEAPSTETYTFTVAGLDDGLRLWINGAVVLDSSIGLRTGSVALTAGQKYDIRAQFWEGSGAAFVTVTWSTSARYPEVLPASRLYSAAYLVNRATGGTATASSQTSNQNSPLAFDGNATTKWLTNGATATAWLQYQFGSGANWPVTEYRLTSANDFPVRDPAAWQFQGSADGTSWTTLDTRSAQTFTARYETKSYPIANTTAYAYYRLNITANVGGATQAIQLAELGLFSPEPLPAAPAGLAAVPGNRQVALTWSPVPGATAYLVKRATTAGGPYTARGEVTSGTAYTDTGLLNGSTYHYVVATAVGSVSGNSSAPVPATPAGLTASVANNVVTLQWSSATWATGYTVKRSTTSGSGYVNLATGVSGLNYTDSTGAAGSTYYYVVAATNASGASGNSAQASAYLNSPGASASAISSPSGNADKAFDGTTATKWYNGGGSPTAWLQYKFADSSPQIVTGYVLTSANDVPQRDPAAWQLLGSNNGTTWTTLDTQSAQVFTARFQTKLYAVPNATAYTFYRLDIIANAGGSGFGVQLAELTLQTSLPSPWSTSDIGSVGALGAAAALNGNFIVQGSGADIWGGADEFRYVYQTATGDCAITARVTSLTNTNEWAKAGVMIRESSAANSRHAMVVVSATNGVALQYRATTGGGSTNINTPALTAPYWVRLVRVGDVFTASHSPDGVTWTTLGSATIPMTTNVLIGLPATSHNDGVRTTATFDTLTVTP